MLARVERQESNKESKSTLPFGKTVPALAIKGSESTSPSKRLRKSAASAFLARGGGLECPKRMGP